MIYRAKVTAIESWARETFSDNTFVTDAKDVYVEVKDEDIADLIEQLNKVSTREKKLKNLMQELIVLKTK